jgi:hypothetical protein
VPPGARYWRGVWVLGVPGDYPNNPPVHKLLVLTDH